MRKPFIIALFLALCFAVMFKYGRSVWYPFWAKIKGMETVVSVVEKLDDKITAQYPNMASLTDGGAIMLIAVKDQKRLELWKQLPEAGWTHIKDFNFTAYSGRLGPKLKRGDGQIPEGIYRMEYLNPNSSYHLSMKITYPNEFERQKGELDGRPDLGDDIFIHGSNATIGCIPIGNDAIEELFYIVAKNGHTNTGVIIAPYDMRVERRRLEIEGIDWEVELYAAIKEALQPFMR